MGCVVSLLVGGFSACSGTLQCFTCVCLISLYLFAWPHLFSDYSRLFSVHLLISLCIYSVWSIFQCLPACLYQAVLVLSSSFGSWSCFCFVSFIQLLVVHQSLDLYLFPVQDLVHVLDLFVCLFKKKKKALNCSCICLNSPSLTALSAACWACQSFQEAMTHLLCLVIS